jgi:hypothetical protein
MSAIIKNNQVVLISRNTIGNVNWKYSCFEADLYPRQCLLVCWIANIRVRLIDHFGVPCFGTTYHSVNYLQTPDHAI